MQSDGLGLPLSERSSDQDEGQWRHYLNGLNSIAYQLFVGLFCDLIGSL